MIRIRMIGLALVAVFAISAVAAASASANRTWWVENAAKTKTQVGVQGSGKKITAKIKAGQEAILLSEIDGMETKVICKKLTINNTAKTGFGEIYNEEPTGGKTGRDSGKIKFEECRLKGAITLICKLTAASAKEITAPPTAEGRSLLVENTGKTKIWNDFLPETTESLFAVIHTEGVFCPVSEDKVKSTLPVGAFGAANEGEGGVAGEISPEGYSVVKTFLFPVTSLKEAINWKKSTIKIGKFADFAPAEEGPASFTGWNPTTETTETLVVEAELTTKEAFDVQ